MIIYAKTAPAPEKDDEPVVRVEKWRRHYSNGETYLVCTIPETGKTRVTSKITYTRGTLFITESGRTYQCLGAESDCPEFVWALAISGLT